MIINRIPRSWQPLVIAAKDPDEITGLTDGCWFQAEDPAVTVLEGIDPDDPCEDADDVRRWNDKLNDSNADQAGANKPLYRSLGGARVEFDGGSEYLDTDNVGGAEGTANNIAIVGVFRRDDAAWHTIFDKRDSGTGTGVFLGVNSGTALLSCYIEDASDNNQLAESVTLVMLSHNTWAVFIDRQNDRIKIYANSTVPEANVDCSGVTASLAGGTGRIGYINLAYGAYTYLDGDLAELTYMYGPGLSENDVQCVLTAFKARWGT